ncbi:MAG: hypothetical protein ACXVPR_04465 [Actinomycetota bacterium]
MLAQLSFSPNATPTLNSGGWVYGAAVLLTVVGVLIVLALVFGYMRFAPRFRRDESAPRSVRAPRLQPGRDAPRRAVNITGAPIIVPAPIAPAPVAAAGAAPAPAVAVAAPAPAASAPAPAPAPAAVAAPIAAPEQPAPAADAAPPAGPSPAATPAAQAAPTPAPAAGEHKEVALDQETFDAKLAELLAKGTDRRVAEGQARRAAMIAARKKAEG